MTAADDLAFFRGATRPALAAGLFLVILSAPAQPARITERHATLTLGAETTVLTPGHDVQAALRQEIQPGWHTYWVNPGDSGLPMAIGWILPPGFAAEPIGWPVPERLRAGSLVSYVYQGDLVLPVTIRVPATLEPGTTATLSAHASWLVCAEICVPEEADVALALPVGTGPAPPDPLWADRIRLAQATIPISSTSPAAITVDRDRIELRVALGDASQLRDFVFFPLEPGIVDNDADQSVEAGAEGVTLQLARGELKAQTLDRLSGVLSFRDGGARGHAIALTVPATAPAIR